LNEPTNTMSSATVTLACMKSWTLFSVHGVEGLPAKGSFSSAVASSGIFHAERPFSRHWWKTWSVCGSSTMPAMSTRARSPASASVAMIGADVITGEATRTRSRARPIPLAIACESSSPFPGVNQARAPAPLSSFTISGSARPLCSTSRRSQSSSKFVR
jgi:hypothetical protein